MTKTEARDYVDEQIDNDFMEDVSARKINTGTTSQKDFFT